MEQVFIIYDERRPMEQVFIIYDERALSGNPDAAQVLCTASTLDDARRAVCEDFPRGVIYRYDVAPAVAPGKSEQLVNETFIEGPREEPTDVRD